MWGADDPFNRKPLMWKEFHFDPETRNFFQQGIKQFDSLAFKSDQCNWYQTLISIRKSNAVLSNGNCTFFYTEGKKLAYKRSNGENYLLIYFNVEDHISEFELPLIGKYKDLLSGQLIEGNKFKMAALSSMILKKIK